MSGTGEIVAGFMPLSDSAILVAAAELGFAENENLKLTLVRETSWANIRDRVAVGHFQAAHMLAPMPIASNLGLSPLPVPIVVPLAVGLGGNAVTVSSALFEKMSAVSHVSVLDAAGRGRALADVIAARKASGEPMLRFAVVHPFSAHNYELRYWLAASGIHPEKDVEIIVVPPSFMADALKAGVIDGYCVGEPWNSVAVAEGTGHFATVKAAIWKLSPEKVLGLKKDWAEKNEEALHALLRAMYHAAVWCQEPANRFQLARLLSKRQYLGLREDVILPALEGKLQIGGGESADIPNFFVPAAHHATFPWKSHALWFYSQMVRWGHADGSPTNQALARNSYRPDIYRAALQPLDIPLPEADMKSEESDGVSAFFDGAQFDPENPLA
ncbi:CmpA/NrtA family ABC transporter substrate-binding protein [Rhizobium sp. L1K21]|uniref:CmpA/NrtA family ABC transporter substrate-binding protein n=1 Tax=Rhizobium sp. L1K21 TaxID=2954933 RepID=UPI0020921434|nr:CmpA/NrtA family ABC transporter substrate-binding protein [Rhizobium sp. L1K21]MCO6186947.1 ABC transporter substrate-binding protein [Rhizobium sp. L1K21]